MCRASPAASAAAASSGAQEIPVAVGVWVTSAPPSAKQVRHWSGAHLGESFNVEVQDSPDEKAAKGKMKLQLRREESSVHRRQLQVGRVPEGCKEGQVVGEADWLRPPPPPQTKFGVSRWVKSSSGRPRGVRMHT